MCIEKKTGDHLHRGRRSVEVGGRAKEDRSTERVEGIDGCFDQEVRLKRKRGRVVKTKMNSGTCLSALRGKKKFLR